MPGQHRRNSIADLTVGISLRSEETEVLRERLNGGRFSRPALGILLLGRLGYVGYAQPAVITASESDSQGMKNMEVTQWTQRNRSS